MIRRPPRSTLSSSSAASDVYKRQGFPLLAGPDGGRHSVGSPAEEEPVPRVPRRLRAGRPHNKTCRDLVDPRKEARTPIDTWRRELQSLASPQLARWARAGARDDRLPGLLAGRLRAAAHTGGGCGTNIRSGPTNGVRSLFAWSPKRMELADDVE